MKCTHCIVYAMDSLPAQTCIHMLYNSYAYMGHI